MCHFELGGYVVQICVFELAFVKVAKIGRKKTWYVTSIALANGEGRVEFSITTTKGGKTAVIYFNGYFVGTNTKR